MRGRPRKADTRAPIEDIAKAIDEAKPLPQESDHVPRLHELTPTATRGGMVRRDSSDNIIQSDNVDRMAHVLGLCERAKNYGGNVRGHNNCVTITVGTYSECINIASADSVIDRFVSRCIHVGGN